MEKARSIASTILTTKNSDNVNITFYSPDEMKFFGDLGIGWNAMFVELEWLFSLKEKLIPTRHLFKINRGERRGWDKMFYPERGHGIEPKYIKPVLKSPQEIDSLVARPDREAFCCSTSLEDLDKKGDRGALSWIKKFEIQVNTRGLGSLDLSSRKLKKNLFMLNPDILTPTAIEKIKQKFNKLLEREILPLSKELAK